MQNEGNRTKRELNPARRIPFSDTIAITIPPLVMKIHVTTDPIHDRRVDAIIKSCPTIGHVQESKND